MANAWERMFKPPLVAQYTAELDLGTNPRPEFTFTMTGDALFKSAGSVKYISTAGDVRLVSISRYACKSERLLVFG